MDWGLQLIVRLLLLFLTVTVPGAANLQLPRSFSALQLARKGLPWHDKLTLTSWESSENTVAQPPSKPTVRASVSEVTCRLRSFNLDIDRLYFLGWMLINCRIVSKACNLRHELNFQKNFIPLLNIHIG
jgi:hypothetical protein